MILTLTLALAWFVAGVVIILDMVDWQMRPDTPRERFNRMPAVLLVSLLLALAATLTVALPYL